MDDLDREVGGLRCRDVLERLSAFVDGDLDPSELTAVRGHLRGCDRCERFGGRFAGVVTGLRRELAAPEALAPEVADRLRSRLGVTG